MRKLSWGMIAALACASLACSEDETGGVDAAPPDVGADAGDAGGRVDGGFADAAGDDASTPDAETPDASPPPDSGPVDTGCIPTAGTETLSGTSSITHVTDNGEIDVPNDLTMWNMAVLVEQAIC